MQDVPINAPNAIGPRIDFCAVPVRDPICQSVIPQKYENSVCSTCPLKIPLGLLQLVNSSNCLRCHRLQQCDHEPCFMQHLVLHSSVSRCSAGNAGMTLINHPLWFPLRESLGSFPHPLLSTSKIHPWETPPRKIGADLRQRIRSRIEGDLPAPFRRRARFSNPAGPLKGETRVSNLGHVGGIFHGVCCAFQLPQN